MEKRPKYNYDGMSVFTCKKCLSLAIVEEDGCSYCKDCGHTGIEEMQDINYWDAVYRHKYGVKFIDKISWAKKFKDYDVS